MKILSLICSLVLFPTLVFATPFLVCDPPPADQEVTSYEVYIDGSLVATVDAEADGSLKYDLSGITPGSYEFNAKAINIWGVSELSPNPYQSPAGILSPTGLRMTP